jgi:hypothetical protein
VIVNGEKKNSLSTSKIGMAWGTDITYGNLKISQFNVANQQQSEEKNIYYI